MGIFQTPEKTGMYILEGSYEHVPVLVELFVTVNGLEDLVELPGKRLQPVTGESL